MQIAKNYIKIKGLDKHIKDIKILLQSFICSEKTNSRLSALISPDNELIFYSKDNKWIDYIYFLSQIYNKSEIIVKQINITTKDVKFFIFTQGQYTYLIKKKDI